MPDSIPYLPGRPAIHPRPLARFLPPIPEGVVESWLRANFPILEGSQPDFEENNWILDPFGASPWQAIEAAQAGFKVLVAANNPIARFLLEMAAAPPSREELRLALADLAAMRKGEERLELHIRSLYQTHCDRCGEPVIAEEFLWDRGASSTAGATIQENPYPFARVYHCQNCGEGGEHPALPEDVEKAAQFSSGGLHRARALERVAAQEDPDRHHVEEALSVYLPRAIYVLFTLVNKLDKFNTPEGTVRDHRRLFDALLLTAFDQSNTLWPYPTGRSRPRQLTIPPRFREKNIWLALEEAVDQWAAPEAGSNSQIPMTVWPENPKLSSGVVLFEGRLKDLAEEVKIRGKSKSRFGAVLTALPRPNQAFWTLSALWAGWLWGREAVGPFKSVLRRRRYDWGWHSTALQAALEHLPSLVHQNAPFLGLIGELEPGFLSAALIAADEADFDLKGLALRSESNQAQIVWREAAGVKTNLPGPLKKSQSSPVETASRAALTYLRERGEPSAFLNVLAATLTALIESGQLRHLSNLDSENLPSPAESLSRLNDLLADSLSYRRGFLRYGGSDKSLEAGLWWLRDPTDGLGRNEKTAAPLADRVEISLVSYLLRNPGSSMLEIDKYLCETFRGLFTPSLELIQVCTDSYGEQSSKGGEWTLKQQEAPGARREDLRTSFQILKRIADRLGYRTEGRLPLLWLNTSGEIQMACYVLASAVVGRVILTNPYPPKNTLVALPDGRANLLAYKLDRDPRLRQKIEEGWRFINFRQLHWLVDRPNLTASTLDEQLTLDLSQYDAPQMRLL